MKRYEEELCLRVGCSGITYCLCVLWGVGALVLEIPKQSFYLHKLTGLGRLAKMPGFSKSDSLIYHLWKVLN